jgi:phosphoglycolate phosphatase
LVDTAPELAHAVNHALAALGHAQVRLETVIGYIGGGTRELMRCVLLDAGADPTLMLDPAMDLFNAKYAAVIGTSAQPYPGVPEALARLRAKGVHLVVVTNKDHALSLRLLERLKLDGYFEWVIGGDSLPHRKPHPLPILHCLERLGLSGREAAHLGDSRADIEAARRAGVNAWAVPYGYNHGEPIETADPERVFASVAAMTDYLGEAMSTGGHALV